MVKASSYFSCNFCVLLLWPIARCDKVNREIRVIVFIIVYIGEVQQVHFNVIPVKTGIHNHLASDGSDNDDVLLIAQPHILRISSNLVEMSEILG